MTTKQQLINQLTTEWATNPRWQGVERPYTAEQVINLRGSLQVEHTIAKRTSQKFWELLHSEKVVPALGCLTGNQAIEAVQAGLKAIYCSGWQVAADANTASAMYPDQSLYPVDSVPALLRRINNAFMRTDQIHWLKNDTQTDWFAPIIADAEAGFGGNLNAFELMKHMIEAGAAAVHWEDQLASAKKCGHLGGKVLVPTQEAINKLVAARLAADVMATPTVIIARTDADAANLLTADIDPRDQPFITGKRSSEGFFYVKNGVEQAISRGLSYAPYADLVWCETSKPSIEEAREFAAGIHAKFPNKLLAYNCSPSFNWRAKLSEKQIQTFREELADLGYKFQFITLAGWHALNFSMFDLARNYQKEGMWAYSKLQQAEFDNEQYGYRATKHQSFVGTGYFDEVQNVITQGNSSTVALKDSTEAEQFHG